MRRTIRRALAWPIVALMAVACIGLGVWLGARWLGSHGRAASTPIVVARGDLAQDERATIEVFEATRDPVVFITTLQRARESQFSLNVLEQPKGTGTGFLWDDRGHVVTNFHVIAVGNAFRVTLSDNEAHEATLVGVEPSTDLAALRIAPPDSPPLVVVLSLVVLTSSSSTPRDVFARRARASMSRRVVFVLVALPGRLPPPSRGVSTSHLTSDHFEGPPVEVFLKASADSSRGAHPENRRARRQSSERHAP